MRMIAEHFPVLMDLNWISLIVRTALALFCGGVVGYERDRYGMPAGLRTHMLVCLGAALTMMTNQFAVELLGATDPVRLGAQVVSGIGFLGAGTIIVTGRYHVSGLTTAAGLWASACMGLAIGVGFYEGAILTCLAIIFIERVLLRAERKKSATAGRKDIIVELDGINDLGTVLAALEDHGVRVRSLERGKLRARSEGGLAVILSVEPGPQDEIDDVLRIVWETEGVRFAEQIF